MNKSFNLAYNNEQTIIDLLIPFEIAKCKAEFVPW